MRKKDGSAIQPETLFSVGDEVLISITKLKPNLDKKWLDPYQITTMVSKVTYEVYIVDWQRRR